MKYVYIATHKEHGRKFIGFHDSDRKSNPQGYNRLFRAELDKCGATMFEWQPAVYLGTHLEELKNLIWFYNTEHPLCGYNARRAKPSKLCQLRCEIHLHRPDLYILGILPRNEVREYLNLPRKQRNDYAFKHWNITEKEVRIYFKHLYGTTEKQLILLKIDANF